jgi:hypothetical protein
LKEIQSYAFLPQVALLKEGRVFREKEMQVQCGFDQEAASQISNYNAAGAGKDCGHRTDALLTAKMF